MWTGRLAGLSGSRSERSPAAGSANPTSAVIPRASPARRPVHNSLAALRDGEIEAVYRKNRLPNYGVFDEVRYFEPGGEPQLIELGGTHLGLTICEDLWEPGPPGSLEAQAGAQLLLNASGSPYLRGKGIEREEMFAERARAYGVPIAFCNLVGGQDELVFDGHSFVVDAAGETVARARQFAPDLLLWELGGPPGRLEQPLDDLDEVYGALVLGVRDYTRKNRFERAIVGLSGGIDSALVALVAADALGAERLTCVVMPSRYSSEGTQAASELWTGRLAGPSGSRSERSPAAGSANPTSAVIPRASPASRSSAATFASAKWCLR